MSKSELGGYHLKISVWLFLIGLAFPAYYINEDYEPQLSLLVFISGWLGVIDWNFTWFANAFFGLSLISRNNTQKSIAFAFISLVLAISFILHDEIFLGMNVGFDKVYGNVAGYGFGYLFWVTSIGIFLIGQLTLSPTEKKHNKIFATIAYLIFIGTASLSFLHHFYMSDKGAYALFTERGEALDRACESARDLIHQTLPEKLDSLYIRGGLITDHERNIFGYWKKVGSGSIEASLPGISFYEKDNSDRHTPGRDTSLYISHNIKTRERSFSNELKSRYLVEMTEIQFSKRLGIIGYRTTMTDLTNNTLIAETSYYYQKRGGRLCGEISGNRFSGADFFKRILHSKP